MTHEDKNCANINIEIHKKLYISNFLAIIIINFFLDNDKFKNIVFG